MKTNKVMWLIVALVVVATVVFTFGTFGSYSQNNKTSSPTPTPLDETSIKRAFPVVDYAGERDVSPMRQEKGSKYDKYKILNPNIIADDKDVAFVDWLTTSEALPIEESSIIATGRIVTSEAFLSTNKASVYSEFKIEIEKVYKNSSKAPFEEKCIRAERDGGVVVFPSRFRLWYFVSGQRMPVVGGRYLFFLTHDFPIYGHQDRDLYLLTAYKLSDGKVFPLDNADGGSHPTAFEFKQKDESYLLTELEKRLQAGNKKPNERRPQ